ncbi:hypothetical protein BEH_07490 [Priestia filamentosa]|uniref:Uncharacterized protein n=1 Tax=Priestia filamentosa TaxID=1402861 RepID=A0A0H4KEB3_9BACI|nr:hypothetical protein [Priestia filamentosa]AKO91955.1 hypothetical protein BEH_07490 [Priestia filamentosa]
MDKKRIIKLMDIEQRVNKDKELKDKIVEKFENNLSTRKLNKGRVRPKDSKEDEILKSFKRKDGEI